MEKARHPKAIWWLAGVSFAESSFFPIPPDVMLVPMVLARPDRGFRIALVCTVASVLGGLFGYAIGYFLYETAGRWIIDLYGMQAGFAEFRAQYDRWGLWIILIKGLTPIPYKLVTIASGLAHFSFFTFVWASVVTRGARFFLTATLLKYYGPKVQEEFEKRMTLYTGLLLGLIVIAVIALKVLG